MRPVALTAPAAERNKQPILEVLRQVLPETGLVLEIASGTGQHVEHFSRHLPGLTWQPSDLDPEMRDSMQGWIDKAERPNLRSPLDLDVSADPWPIQAADAVLCINMIHIAPWTATTHLIAGADRLLGSEGVLVLYGPYRRDGRHTADSNEVFDRQLQARNAAWGVRDLDEVIRMAENRGFLLDRVVGMPANNLTVVFRRTSDARSTL